MSDKERLENLNPTIVDNQGNVTLKGDDYHWLMEQAEKAEKYRETLKYYADEKHYEPYCIPMGDYASDVTEDNGEIARKALDGEGNV